MKKLMMAMALVAVFAGASLYAEEAKKEECTPCKAEEKKLQDMSVEELKAMHAKKVAEIADEKDEAKKAEIAKAIEEIKAVLEEKGVVEEEKKEEKAE